MTCSNELIFHSLVFGLTLPIWNEVVTRFHPIFDITQTAVTSNWGLRQYQARITKGACKLLLKFLLLAFMIFLLGVDFIDVLRNTGLLGDNSCGLPSPSCRIKNYISERILQGLTAWMQLSILLASVRTWPSSVGFSNECGSLALFWK